MRILQLIYESLHNPFGFGGAGVRAYEIYKRLKDRHDITLLCMRYPGAKDGEIEDLRHLFVGTESKSLTKSVLAYTLKASNYVKKHGRDYDVIVENFLPSTPFFSRFLTKTPVILQVQGIMERHSLKKFNPIYAVPMYLVEKFYPSLYDKFVFVSEVTMNKVISSIGNKKYRSYLVPNGIDEALLHLPYNEEDYMLFLSRIDIYTKGLDLLIKAFKKISEKYPSIRLVLAGYEFDKFDRLLSRYEPSLRGKVHYAGFVTGEEKIRLISGAKIFVLPSRHESSPISIIEAAACGKPVIVSNIPELKFVEEGGFGISFKTNSVESLTQSIKYLLDNPKKRMELGIKGREFSKSYLWDKVAIEFENALEYFSKNRN
jgi:glycogen(starch) synthase